MSMDEESHQHLREMVLPLLQRRRNRNYPEGPAQKIYRHFTRGEKVCSVCGMHFYHHSQYRVDFNEQDTPPVSYRCRWGCKSNTPTRKAYHRGYEEGWKQAIASLRKADITLEKPATEEAPIPDWEGLRYIDDDEDEQA